jgi:D-lactate dehydrogenase (cytochrome)
VDPGADASIGGMAATRASGTNAVRYGTMKENVLALTVVLADGRVIHTGRRTKKSSAGYDLTRLMVGSEGTLGIITEITLRVYPQPEAVSAAICAFPTIESAAQAVIEAIQLGVPLARVELMDPLSMQAINRHSGLSLRVAPTLFFEFHGSPSGIKEHAQVVQEVAAEHGGQDFDWATDSDQRSRLWAARHNAYFACLQLRPGARSITTDVCVPISRLAQCIAETHQDIKSASMPIPLLGHVGDGNFHLLILADPDSPEEYREAESINRRLVARAIAMDGTCTGEHGIGLGKMEFMRAEHGDAVDVMHDIKRALDPHNLLNPGKILPR